jgi:hypothetical protein
MSSYWSPHARFLQIDIKDYFLSGSHDDLVEYSSRHCKRSHVREFRDFMSASLNNQLVSHACRGVTKYYKCVQGSGMGLTASGEVSDCAFLELVEVPLLLSGALARDHGVVGYWRFKDDILLLLDVPDVDFHVSSVMKKMKEHSKAFKLKQVACSRCVDFLDVTLYFDASGQIRHDIFIKSSKIGHPLCCTSFHHPSVHLSWPRNEIRRIRARCSSHASANTFIQSFKARLNHESICHPGLTPVRGFVPVKKITLSEDHFRLTLPFHPSLLCLAPLCAKLNFKISWKNGNPHMLRSMRSLQSKMPTNEVSVWLYGAASAEEEEALFFVSNKTHAYAQP